MKRVLVAVLVLGVMVSGAFAASNEVNSVNVVGFQNLDIASEGYTMVAAPFNSLTGSNSVSEMIGDALTQGNTKAEADNILFFDPVEQKYITIWKSPIGWLNNVTPTTQEFWTARGFWVRTSQSSNQILNVAGDVPLANSTTQTVFEGYNLVAYPYPANVVLTNTDLHAKATQGNTKLQADNLMKYDSAEQKYKSYWKSPIGWLDNVTPVPDLELKQGEAFFFLRRTGNGSFSWVENRPYSL